MEYEEFIQFFTHEVNYNLKMLGVPWRAKYENTGGREEVLVVIPGVFAGDALGSRCTESNTGFL